MSASTDVEPDWSRLPATPGVFVLEDERGHTVGISVTADLRRLVRSRLATTEPGTRRRGIDYRAITRHVRAVPVGSAFEADWAFLHLARARLPLVYRSLLDRWQAWFVHCDPRAPHPRWVKTAHPGQPPTGPDGIAIGPFPDKHVAARYIEILEDAFDLCRYHHILVQSPHGAACAYKEMGRCPAPCDGSIPFDDYRRQVQASIDFAAASIDDQQARLESAMHEASRRLEFEAATRLRRQLDVIKEAARPAMRRAGRLEDFHALAVMPSERAGQARLFRIGRGPIRPWLDVASEADDDLLAQIIEIEHRAATTAAPATETMVEELGLVCQHLFRPRRKKSAEPGRFLFVPDELDRRRLRAAIRHAAGGHESGAAAITDQSIDDQASEVSGETGEVTRRP